MVSHCEDDVLSLLALGEPVSPEEQAHLADCSRCRSELDQLAAIVASVRSITPADHPMMPPDSVWQGIARELGLEEGASATVTAIGNAPSKRGPRTWLVAAAAAAVGVIVGGSVVAGVDSNRTSGQIVATTSLAPIDDSGQSGTATVISDETGASLTIDVPGLPPVEGYYEVWMATSDLKTMVALGTLRPGEPATFTLPPGMDVSSFPVVDVSVEDFDGEAGHSPVSVVRGELQT